MAVTKIENGFQCLTAFVQDIATRGSFDDHLYANVTKVTKMRCTIF